MKTREEQIKLLLEKGVAEVIDRKSLEQKLRAGKTLRVKLGIDPTAPDIHLGHSVPLRKLRQFQDLGHKAVLIIGDWTAQIGDPSGQDKTRAALSAKEVKENARTYLEQAYKILDKKNSEVHFQSEWLSKFSLKDVVGLASKVTVSKLMSHETFKLRLKNNLPFSFHEALYPLLQGYDSVMVKADVEIGALEQKFNLLMGREVQKKSGQSEQEVLMTKYLMGLDGKMKMSKSLGNYIAILDTPEEMFGKIMSIPDSLLENYFELLTDIPVSKLKEELKSGTNSWNLKARLAREIVIQFHSETEADKAEKELKEKNYKNGIYPDVVDKDIRYAGSTGTAVATVADIFGLSRSETRRLIEQGAIRYNGRIVADPDEEAKEGIYTKGKHQIGDYNIQDKKKMNLNSYNIKDSTIKIKVNNEEYSVVVAKGSFRKKVEKNRTRWEMKYEVIDKNSEKIGFGDFSLNCRTEHQHLEDKRVFNILAKIGAFKVAEDIKNDLPIESKGYNIYVYNCRE